MGNHRYFGLKCSEAFRGSKVYARPEPEPSGRMLWFLVEILSMVDVHPICKSEEIEYLKYTLLLSSVSYFRQTAYFLRLVTGMLPYLAI